MARNAKRKAGMPYARQIGTRSSVRPGSAGYGLMILLFVDRWGRWAGCSPLALVPVWRAVRNFWFVRSVLEMG